MAHVLFDVNGTLLDPRALTASWEGAPSGLGLSVLDQTVLQSMVDTITGEFRPFPEYIRAALAHRAALAGLGDDAVQSGMAAAAALPPYPDAGDALSRLRVAGHTPSALTNSPADAARSAPTSPTCASTRMHSRSWARTRPTPGSSPATGGT